MNIYKVSAKVGQGFFKSNLFFLGCDVPKQAIGLLDSTSVLFWPGAEPVLTVNSGDIQLSPTTRQARWQNSLCSPCVVLVPLCNLVLQKPWGPASLLPVSWILEWCPGTHLMRDTQVDTLGQTLGTAYPILSVLSVPRIGQILSRWMDLGPLPWLFPNALHLSSTKLWLINCLN